jgi:hypothetical protein
MYESWPIKAVAPTDVYAVYCKNGVITRTALNASPSVTYNGNNYRQGTDLPSWRQKIAHGEDATTYFEASRFKILNWGYGTYELTRGSSYPPGVEYLCKSKYYGMPGVSFTLPTLANGSAALDMAKRRFVSQAKQKLNPIQMGVVAGELMKTLHMVRHPLMTFRKGLDTYYHKLMKASGSGRFRGLSREEVFRKRKEMVTGAYLEATYGWQPLVADVQGGLKALEIYRENNPFEITRVRAKGKDLQRYHEVLTNTQAGGFITLTTDFLCESSVSVWLTGGVKVWTDGSTKPWHRVFGMELKNFVPTVWELLPYSFLIDYFTNVGSIIDANSILSGRVAWLCKTTKTVRGRQLASQKCAPTASFTNLLSSSCSPCRFAWRKVDVVRTGLESFVPDFRVRLPGFGTVQALNIGALALQAAGARRFKKTPLIIM